MKNEPLIISLSEIQESDSNLVGGKGMNLAKMVLAGQSVPDGFVITAQTTVEDIQACEAQIVEYFDRLGSEYVAVRSSATTEDSNQDSFAGQFETYLNVTRDALLASILKCKSSKNTKTVEEYAASRDIATNDIQVAVVVQKMIDAETAGVCFTVNPVTKDTNQAVVEAVYGLGELLVSGEATPDTYVFDKNEMKVVDKNIEEQTYKIIRQDGQTTKVPVPDKEQSLQKLSDVQIEEVVQKSVALEQTYEKPLDIEFAFADEQLHFLQARPITTIL